MIPSVASTERLNPEVLLTSANSAAASKKVLEFFGGEFAQRVRDHLYLLLSVHFRRCPEPIRDQHTRGLRRMVRLLQFPLAMVISPCVADCTRSSPHSVHKRWQFTAASRGDRPTETF